MQKCLSQHKFLPALPRPEAGPSAIEELATRINEARVLRQQAAREAEALRASATSAYYQDGKHWTTVRDAVLKRKGAVRSAPFGSQLLRGIRGIRSRCDWNSRCSDKSLRIQKRVVRPSGEVRGVEALPGVSPRSRHETGTVRFCRQTVRQNSQPVGITAAAGGCWNRHPSLV